MTPKIDANIEVEKPAYLEDDTACILMKDEDKLPKLVAPQAEPRTYEIVWVNVVVFTLYHLAGLYGLYLCFTKAQWATIAYGCVNYYVTVLGIGAGVHRLWCHRAYKATTSLQIFLMLAQSLANQHSIVHWVRDHRLHHKFSDTDADPHNASRGFFFSHMGWIMVKKHPEAKKRIGLMDMSDIYANPVVMFQKRHENWLILFTAFVVPTVIPILWQESISTAFFVNMLRYILTLNATFIVNSIAHMWGWKPYDKNILPVQNISVAVATFGEGYHNYHHVFPYDYRAGEVGVPFNFTTAFIDFCAKLGLAYDLRFATEDVIIKRKMRTGDGTDSH